MYQNGIPKVMLGRINIAIKINILNKPRVEKNITLGGECTPEENEAYTKLFKGFRDVFT